MKVCFIVGTLGRGGAERQLVFMLQALQKEGIASRVLCLTRGEANESAIRNMGVRVEWVGKSPSRLSRLRNIVRFVKQQLPDILQSSHFYTNFYTAAAGRYLNIKSIGAIRSNVLSELDANGLWGRCHLKLPSHLIANSKLGVQAAISHGVAPAKIDFVPNVVEMGNSCADPASNEDRTLNLLFVGRLVEVKRPHLFVDLAARLRQQLPEASLKFTVAGEGPLRSDLEQSVSNNRLSKDVVFLGECADLNKIYRDADILVSTSRFEGTPNVILEAMARGIPSVATRVGGVPEIVDESRGIVVDPADFDELVGAAKKLILDTEIRRKFGCNCRSYIANNHSIDSLGRRLADIYSRLSTHD